MTQPTPLLTAAQVVDRLALAGIVVIQETVRQWARSKQIAVVRLPSGRYLFPADAVDAIAVPTQAERERVA